MLHKSSRKGVIEAFNIYTSALRNVFMRKSMFHFQINPPSKLLNIKKKDKISLITNNLKLKDCCSRI
jgi:hypothetical protein